MPNLSSDVAWVMIGTMATCITALCAVIRKLYADNQGLQRDLLDFVSGVRNIRNGG